MLTYDEEKYKIMFTYELTKSTFNLFYSKWINKADECSDVIEKFIYNYIAYNGLYNSLQEIKDIEGQTKIGAGDFEKATKIWIENISENQLLNILKSEELNKIHKLSQEIIELIDKKEFIYDYKSYRHNEIVLFKQNRANFLQKVFNNWKKANVKDDTLKGFLLPHNSVKNRVNALLTIMYKIRCNLIHGHKNLSGKQQDNIRIGNEIIELFISHVYNEWERTIDSYIKKYN